MIDINKIIKAPTPPRTSASAVRSGGGGGSALLRTAADAHPSPAPVGPRAGGDTHKLKIFSSEYNKSNELLINF